MATTKVDERFFESTRGRIVTLLRKSRLTVNDLAEALGLTDNAIRAHLLTLERDGLVTPDGTIKGFRKPHLAYRLTGEARHIFPKSYDSLLNRLVNVLKLRTQKSILDSILREVGVNIASARLPVLETGFDARVRSAISTLEDLGGAPVLIRTDEGAAIKSESCPFADVVAEHPEICKVAESMVEEIVGSPVQEVCDRTGLPKCQFTIKNPA